MFAVQPTSAASSGARVLVRYCHPSPRVLIGNLPHGAETRGRDMLAAEDSCLRMDAEEVEAADLATRKRRYHEREDAALEEQWEETKRRVLADALAEKQDAKNEETEMEQWAAREERRYWEDRCGRNGRDWASSEEFDPEYCSDCSSLHGSEGVWEVLSEMRSAFDEENRKQRDDADAWLHPSGDGSVPTAELPLEVPLCGPDGDTDSESDFEARSCRSEADSEGRVFGTVQEACAALMATGDDELHNMQKLGFGKDGMIGYSHCFRLLRPMAFSEVDSPSADAAELKLVNTLINAASALEAAGGLRFDCELVPAGTVRASVVPPVQPPSDRVCHLRGWLHVTVRKPAPAAASQGQSGAADPLAALRPLLDWLYLNRSMVQATGEDASRLCRAITEDHSAHKRTLAAVAGEKAETERLRRSLKEAQDEGRRMQAELQDLRARHARAVEAMNSLETDYRHALGLLLPRIGAHFEAFKAANSGRDGSASC